MVQVFQVADRIAAAGFTVAVPNVLQEAGPWPMSDFPPSDNAKFMQWINAQEATSVVAKVTAARKHIEAKGVTSFGVIGFCWGASISLYMARTHAASLHAPVFVTLVPSTVLVSCTRAPHQCARPVPIFCVLMGWSYSVPRNVHIRLCTPLFHCSIGETPPRHSKPAARHSSEILTPHWYYVQEIQV